MNVKFIGFVIRYDNKPLGEGPDSFMVVTDWQRRLVKSCTSLDEATVFDSELSANEYAVANLNLCGHDNELPKVLQVWLKTERTLVNPSFGAAFTKMVRSMPSAYERAAD